VEVVLLSVVIALIALMLLSLFVLYQVVRQQGRLLLRIETLESGAELEETDAEPIGLAAGEPVPPFRLRDLAGKQFGLDDFAGRRVLLVNWSPDCGFCDVVAPDLAKLGPELAKRETELVLATHGPPKRIRAFHEEHGLEAAVLRQSGSDLEVFEDLGTPVAYLLDEQGRVASPLAVGAGEVLELAREAAGERRRLGAERSLTESRIEREGLRAGTKAPDFVLPDVDGKTVSLADYRGRKVLLVFSDLHCGPCEELAPGLAELQREHAESNLQVVMVGRGDPGENRRKAREHGFDFPVVVQKGWKVSKTYGIFATPVAFLIDERGVIERDVAPGAEAIVELAEAALK
jgi:peroxiredoxin